MRKPPEDISPPADITPVKLDVIEQKRVYELITPLCGGGVIHHEPDPITVVRATEIRGQLRFWWRACRGWQSNSDPSIMKTQEDAIWGKASRKGEKGIPPEQTVQIFVDTEAVQKGTAVKPYYKDERGRLKSANGIPGYAAFPLQPDKEKLRMQHTPIPDIWKGVRFTLTISYPSTVSKEIEAALWAWETFGGIGARTRRGFGALRLLAINDMPYQSFPTSSNVEQWITYEANKYIEAGSFPADMPHLSRNMTIVVTAPSNNALWAWNDLMNALSAFRLYKGGGRKSVWPEADVIRGIAGTAPAPHIEKFPRAAFGLPIIFHFTGHNAPKDNYTLNEADLQATDEPMKHKERFASPLILRPLLCRDNRAVGLALLLEGSRVDPDYLILENEETKTRKQVQGMLAPDEAREVTRKMPELRNEIDILQAFMKSLREPGNE